MRKLAERAAALTMLVLCACSDRSAWREETGRAAEAQVPSIEGQPLLGVGEAGWRLPPTGDFNGDGLMDMVWRDHTRNRVGVWLMSGTQVLEQGPMMPGPPGPNWIVLSGYGDINFDGMSDLLWFDPPRNLITVWLMRGTEPFERGPEIPGPPGDGWTCAPCTDFNLDGMADLLWYNPTTNRMAVWLMAGTTPLERGPEIPGPPGAGWIAGFAADFDQDGRADVFWYNPTTNRMAVWLMDSTEVRVRGPELPGPAGDGWILAAAGDFNADHIVDAAFFNLRTRRATISLMYGTGLLEQGPELPAPPGEDWALGIASDCNGDGMFDLLWLGTRPLRTEVWLMRGTAPWVRGALIAGPGGVDHARSQHR